MEARLKELSSSTVRRNFCESIYEELLGYSPNFIDLFPHSYVEALDRLLIETIEKHFSGTSSTERPIQTTILKGYFHFTILAIKKINNNKRYVQYNKNLLGKTYTLFGYYSDEQTPPSLDAVAFIRDKRLTFAWSRHDSIDTKVYNNSDFFHVTYVKRDLFENSSGVAIRNTCPNGTISFNGRFYHFGFNNQNKHIIVFFDRDNPHFFDVFGEMIFERLTCSEMNIKRRLNRMLEVKARMDEKTPDDLRNLSIIISEQLKQKWVQNPEQFRKGGIHYVLNGEVETVTNSDGIASFPHNKNGARKRGFYISTDNLCSPIKLKFSGCYVAAYLNDNHDNGLVNCHEFSEPINYFHYLRYLDATHLKQISLTISCQNNRLHQISGHLQYHFSINKVRELYGQSWDSVRYVGILSNTVADKFEILIIDNDGKFTSIPMQPCSKNYSRRYRGTEQKTI